MTIHFASFLIEHLLTENCEWYASRSACHGVLMPLTQDLGDVELTKGQAFAGFAFNHQHDLRNQRHDLRQDQRRLEELKQERHEEIREGDRGEARDYNAKIREQEKDIRRDRKNLKDEERERHGKGYHDHD